MKPYYQDDYATIYHGDCREIMPEVPKMDLVLADPPYGIGEAAGKNASRTNIALARDYGDAAWDDKRIHTDTMRIVIGAGAKTCVWGGNYYADIFPPSAAWLVWDKINSGDFADVELAWTNYGTAARLKRHLWNGMIRKDNEQRYHPTQKPVAVMLWCITLCPGNPQTILDPFAGSGTTIIAAKELQRLAIGIELDESYCEIAARRLAAFEPLPFAEPAAPAEAEPELFT